MAKKISPIKVEREVIEIKSTVVFFIFLLCLIKYLLVNKFELVPKYSPVNGFISWCIIMPISVVGCFLSINVTKKYFHRIRNKVLSFNILLVTPMLVYCLYLIILILFSLFLPR